MNEVVGPGEPRGRRAHLPILTEDLGFRFRARTGPTTSAKATVVRRSFAKAEGPAYIFLRLIFSSTITWRFTTSPKTCCCTSSFVRFTIFNAAEYFPPLNLYPAVTFSIV